MPNAPIATDMVTFAFSPSASDNKLLVTYLTGDFLMFDMKEKKELWHSRVPNVPAAGSGADHWLWQTSSLLRWFCLLRSVVLLLIRKISSKYASRPGNHRGPQPALVAHGE